jgi:RNA polymerase sigma-70 factor (ECF subfamily)
MIDADARSAVRSLEAQLRPFIARRVSRPADVDDILQDVFLRMHRGVASLRDDQRFGPWVYQVTRSAIADHQRSAARHPAAPETDASEPAPAPESDGPDEDSAERQLAAHVAPFVAMLPSPYREALTLTELQGVTQREAAEMLGVSLSGMKSRVQRGRVRLRAWLEACCDIALDARGHVMSCERRAGGPAPKDCRCR